MTTMKKGCMTLVAALLLVAGAGPAAAAGVDLRLEPAPIDRLDRASQQRGVRTFVNYCLNCHSAKYMRYNRLTDIGLDLALIQDNLMFASAKVGETMTVAMRPADAKAWFGVVPPDLTAVSRVRGADWLYNYFLGFYRDEGSPSGWNNLVFPNVSMPHVLGELGGGNRRVRVEYKTFDEAKAAALAAQGVVLLTPAREHKYAVETLVTDTPGTLTPVQYQALVADLVNYLDYMGEPAKNKRIGLGLIVLLYLGVLFVFAYWMKREYWKDVH